MSVVGFDFGNESCIVAVARQRGIDVVLNDESKRETPAIVCFGEKQRFIGTAGAASSTMNPKNSISQIKRLIGRQFSDPELQRDLQSLPFNVTEGPDGYPLIHARYLGEMRTFTPTQVLGMVLSNLKSIAEKNLNAAVADCCIGIPVYFTDLERRAVLDAATIAGLHPLRLIHETTATALAYGIYKTDLPENDQLNVAFVDIGHASMQVCIAGFKKGQLKILAHSFDRSLGGRDFDEVLFQHFAAIFKEEYKIDVFRNARACVRLRAACEKLKKVLSANPEAPLFIECLMDEKDVRGFIKREVFEQISAPILQRVKRPLEKALADAGLAVEDVHMVEVVGSASRVPAILKILTEFFGKEPRRTMNASECVARGCALQCAILSPTFKVREFQVNESFPSPILLSWKGSAPDGGVEQQQLVFPKGNPIPSVKAVTFHKTSTFSVDVQYSDVSDLQVPAKISTYTIGPFPTIRSEQSKLKVKVRLNLHGILSLESATLLEEEEVEVPVSKEPAKEDIKMETDEAPSDTAAPIANETDVNMQDAKGTADLAGVENGVTESGDKPVQMETDAKVEAPKKKVKKTNVPVAELVYGAMLPVDVQKAVEKEFEMALQDRVMEETKDKKNAVEAYVYDMRNKLSDKYQDFVTDPEKEVFSAKLQETEDWLYEDGEDETKGVYVAKLEELKKQGDPIEERYKEYTERGTVIDQLAYCINSYREAAMSNDPKFDHIELAEKQKVLNECVEAEAWLREKKQQQGQLPKYATPVLLSADVRKKAEALDRFCRPIMTKPKPAKPATTESPATPPPQGNETEPQGADANVNPSASPNRNADPCENTPAASGEAPPASAEPMETDKSETTSSTA
ncbi:heat shock 70 kDa protein 15-like [Durio zibethinus]|uniref:Heat shock 70 kDa protein 15-like n=1 Tax=Durio zibethinus TaxID=66656 RepID=A0A6P5WFV3_DURZI|nr:heat shock 70 kDa protein 15-like [Durio zibethinus]XP_022714936.1 heat shock 70 kDa protein 15-like [Durio zibethinus]XP_022714937.1 heat shock 70 kDa protein 15-like [Durio zibethinus]